MRRARLRRDCANAFLSHTLSSYIDEDWAKIYGNMWVFLGTISKKSFTILSVVVARQCTIVWHAVSKNQTFQVITVLSQGWKHKLFKIIPCHNVCRQCQTVLILMRWCCQYTTGVSRRIQCRHLFPSPIHVSYPHTNFGWISSTGLGGNNITNRRTDGRRRLQYPHRLF